METVYNGCLKPTEDGLKEKMLMLVYHEADGKLGN